MASVDSVWGIDIGQCALKALKLRNVAGELRVEAFDIIEHPRILSQPDADREQLILNALEQFLARNNLVGSKVVIAAPGQSGFARFVKLPPVEPKQVPEIVRFEAEQQIPFDMHEVIWRWQAFTDPNSPDIEVGIFAMKRRDVAEALERFNEVGITVDLVQMAPLALYNFMDFDEQAAEEGATLLVDVGADKTDLVVADGPRIWTRTLQLGGNNFTAALVKAFKLSFHKAEKVKRAAATHKYARQIFRSMRPVFAELVQEISRSIGYYTSLHRESRFARIVGLGNGFRLPGLQKFLEQNLNVPVVRVDGFNKLPPSAAVNAPAFTENVLSFAAAYGLALQGLGLTKIQTNLLPSEISRQRLWQGKRPWFAAAAALIVAALAGMTWRAYADARTLTQGDNSELRRAESIVSEYQQLKNDWQQTSGLDKAEELRIKRYEDMLTYRDFWPTVQFIVSDAIGRVALDQGRMDEAGLEALLRTPREQRRVVDIDSLEAVYQDNVAGITPEQLRAGVGRSSADYRGPVRRSSADIEVQPALPRPRAGAQSPAKPAQAPAGPTKRGYLVTLRGRTPQRGMQARVFLNDIKQALLYLAKDFPWVEVTVGEVTDVRESTGAESAGPEAGGRVGTAVKLDALTKEDTSGDTQFTIQWVFAIREPSSAGRNETAVAAGRGQP